MYIKEKSVEVIRWALLTKVLSDMCEEMVELQDAYIRNYSTALRSGLDYDIEEHYDALKREIYEIDRKGADEMKRILYEMNDGEITMLCRERLLE